MIDTYATPAFGSRFGISIDPNHKSVPPSETGDRLVLIYGVARLSARDRN